MATFRHEGTAARDRYRSEHQSANREPPAAPCSRAGAVYKCQALSLRLLPHNGKNWNGRRACHSAMRRPAVDGMAPRAFPSALDASPPDELVWRRHIVRSPTRRWFWSAVAAATVVSLLIG